MKNVFNDLISHSKRILLPLNFKKTGNMFLLERSNNIGIIDFQISKDSNIECLIFTINLGIYIGSLKALDNFDVKSKITISDCHWKKRIGFLLQSKSDYWWKIESNTVISDLIKEISEILVNIAIPKIEEYIITENIKRSWEEGNCNGINDIQRLLYLIVLLKETNNNELQKVVDEIKEKSKGKSFETSVKDNFTKIGLKYE